MDAKIAAIILAAGRGERVGGICKALLRTDQQTTFLEQVVQRCRAAERMDIVVVHRDGVKEVIDLAAVLQTMHVPNCNADLGMFSSVQVGLEATLAAPIYADAFLIYPVDHPYVAAKTIRNLIQTFNPHMQLLKPTYDGCGGHPIVISRSLATALMQQPPSTSLRDYLKQHAIEQFSLAVDDPQILRNINHLTS